MSTEPTTAPGPGLKRRAGSTGILGLHHAAHRCRNSEETRAFYEGFLGLPLIEALHLKMDGGKEDVLHTFFQLDDGSAIAFFDAPKRPFEFKNQDDFDLHISFEVENAELLQSYLRRAKEEGIEVRGPSDHGGFHSIYLRDPNGYVVELTNVVNKESEDHYQKIKADRAAADAVMAGFMSVAYGKGDAKPLVHEDTWEKRAADAAAATAGAEKSKL